MLRGEDVLIVITGAETPGGPKDIYSINPKALKYSKSSGFNEATGELSVAKAYFNDGKTLTLYNVSEMKD